ncbi:MAG: hypothetical protein IIA07_01385 [Proteobacteria bacterium]|nr:hypothetical protein [Pseudomonadota bacterium]
MIGLLLAFQLDRWRGGISERQQEQTYINGLIANVEADVPNIEYAIALQSLRLELIDLLMNVALDPAAVPEEPVMFLAAVNQAAYTYTPVLTSHTFENLRSTGDLRLILDESVKNAMFDYYGFDESQRQFRPVQLDIEFRYFELAAGVLSHEQEVFIQDNWRILIPDEIETAKASQSEIGDIFAAAKRLHERPQLVAWLPYVRGLQLEQIAVHGMRLQRAREALETLNNYAQEIQDTN